MKKNTGFYTGIAAILFLIASCSSGKVVEQPVTDAEALAFAKKLEKNINDKNGSFMDESMQWEVFYKRMQNPGGGNAPIEISRKDFKSVVSNMKLGEKTAENLGSDGSFKMLRLYKEGAEQHALYRLYSDAGINYYDFLLTKVKNKTAIADIYIYLSGENISETAGEMIVQMNVATKDKPTADDERRANKLIEARKLLNSGKYAEVVRIVDNLPARLKKIKVFMMTKLIAASRYDADLFEQTLAAYRAAFPGANKMDLMLLDGYITQKKYDEALQGINNLDKQLGTDPMLDLQRGTLYYLAGRQDSAAWYLQRLIKNEPDFEYGYSELIHVYAGSGQKDKAAALFKESKEKHYLSSKTIQMIEEAYPEFGR